MTVGDVNSSSPGSGARFNDGKVPYDLLPLEVVLATEDVRRCPTQPQEILRHLACWQAGTDPALSWALAATFNEAEDQGSVLPQFASAARVFDYGRKKYADWNWAKGMEWSIPLACAVRHCLAILWGEQTDPESGHPHMGHVQCNLLMLLTYAKTFPEGDNRPTKWLRPQTPKAAP